MPIQVRVEPEHRRVRVDVSGEFSMGDILKGIHQSVSHPDFEAGFDVLSDHTRVTAPLTMPQAHGMAARIESLVSDLAGARWAVAAATPASYGMIRMMSVLLERVPVYVEVFDSLDDATAWLDTPLAERHDGQDREGRAG